MSGLSGVTWKPEHEKHRRNKSDRHKLKRPRSAADREVMRKNRRDWIKKYPEKRRAQRWKLTVEKLEQLLAGGCGACGSMTNLGIDHDHVTGRVRGVLCNNHNVALGMVHDSPEELRALALYIERVRNPT
jgi:Recombination endonuclease VII